jgi:hypothetical protein
MVTEDAQDMDLLNEHRSLAHAGKLLRQPETGFGWAELFVVLFDNYCEQPARLRSSCTHRLSQW